MDRVGPSKLSLSVCSLFTYQPLSRVLSPPFSYRYCWNPTVGWAPKASWHWEPSPLGGEVGGVWATDRSSFGCGGYCGQTIQFRPCFRHFPPLLPCVPSSGSLSCQILPCAVPLSLSEERGGWQPATSVWPYPLLLRPPPPHTDTLGFCKS